MRIGTGITLPKIFMVGLSFLSMSCGNNEKVPDGVEILHGGVKTCDDPGRRLAIPFSLATNVDGMDTHTALEEDNPVYGNVASGEWGVAVADFDGDGHLDVFIPRIGDNLLYVGDGFGGFTDVSTSSLLPCTEFMACISIAATAVDFDGDQDMDIVLSQRFGGPVLMENDGSGRFLYSVSEELGIAQQEWFLDFGTSWADYDQDGDLDMLVGQFKDHEFTLDVFETQTYPPSHPDKLLENKGSEGFVLRDDLLPVDTNDGYPFVAGWQDINMDGRQDILMANDHGVPNRSNRAWVQTDEGFVDQSAELGFDVELDSMGMGIGDISGDGKPDFVFTGREEIVLIESLNDTYVETGLSRGVVLEENQHYGWGIDIADFNNDGALDMYATFSHWELLQGNDNVQEYNIEEQPDALYILEEDQFVNRAFEWGLDDVGRGRGFVLADLNEDGWLDIVLREIYNSTTIHLSNCGAESWLNISLKDSSSGNYYGIGAQVTVVADGKRQVRWIKAGGHGLASGGPPQAHFGLGDVDRIDGIEVLWPDGTTSSYDGFEARQFVAIHKE